MIYSWTAFCFVILSDFYILFEDIHTGLILTIFLDRFSKVR